jgi:hypothetical protein
VAWLAPVRVDVSRATAAVAALSRDTCTHSDGMVRVGWWVTRGSSTVSRLEAYTAAEQAAGSPRRELGPCSAAQERPPVGVGGGCAG